MDVNVFMIKMTFAGSFRIWLVLPQSLMMPSRWGASAEFGVGLRDRLMYSLGFRLLQHSGRGGESEGTLSFARSPGGCHRNNITQCGCLSGDNTSR